MRTNGRGTASRSHRRYSRPACRPSSNSLATSPRPMSRRCRKRVNALTRTRRSGGRRSSTPCTPSGDPGSNPKSPRRVPKSSAHSLPRPTRARMEAEQAAADAAVHAHRQLDEAVATERDRAQADLERAHAERERAQADLQRAQADLERVQAERERAQADRQSAQDELSRALAERARTLEDLNRAQAERERSQQELQHGAHRSRTNRTGPAAAQSDHQRAQEDLQRAQNERERAQEDLQRANGERERAQQDLQRAQDALERAQQELERAQTDAEAIREQAARELEQARVSGTRSNVRLQPMRWPTARQVAESMPRDASELLISLRAIDESSSLTEALAAAVRGAALESPRAALFVVNGTTLQEWPVDGVPPVDAGPIRADGREAGFLVGRASHRRDGLDRWHQRPHRTDVCRTVARTTRDCACRLCSTDGRSPCCTPTKASDGQPLASWLETVQILGRHATSVVASLTAVRTAQAMGFIAGRSATRRRRRGCRERNRGERGRRGRPGRAPLREAARVGDQALQRRGGSRRPRAARSAIPSRRRNRSGTPSLRSARRAQSLPDATHTSSRNSCRRSPTAISHLFESRE